MLGTVSLKTTVLVNLIQKMLIFVLISARVITCSARKCLVQKISTQIIILSSTNDSARFPQFCTRKKAFGQERVEQIFHMITDLASSENTILV